MALSKDIWIKAAIGAALTAGGIIGKALLDGMTVPDWTKGIDIRLGDSTPSSPSSKKGYYDYLSERESRAYELEKMKMQQRHELEMAQVNAKNDIPDDKKGDNANGETGDKQS